MTDFIQFPEKNEEYVDIDFNPEVDFIRKKIVLTKAQQILFEEEQKKYQ